MYFLTYVNVNTQHNKSSQKQLFNGLLIKLIPYFIINFIEKQKQKYI